MTGGHGRVETIGALVRQHATPDRVSRSSRLYDTLTQVVTDIAGDLDDDGLVTLVRVSLWTSIDYDDLFDDPDATPAELAAARSLIRDTLAGQRPDAGHRFAVELAELLGTLRARDRSGGVLVARFGEALLDAAEASIAVSTLSAEVARGDREPPSVGDYLALAGRDLNYRTFCLAMLILYGASPSAGGADRIDRSLAAAAIAVRLANDLRSQERDRAAGRLNVADLKDRAGEPFTPQLARDQIDHQVELHQALLADLADLDQVARILARTFEESLGVYRRGDLR